MHACQRSSTVIKCYTISGRCEPPGPTARHRCVPSCMYHLCALGLKEMRRKNKFNHKLQAHVHLLMYTDVYIVTCSCMGSNSKSIWNSLSRRSWWRCPEIQSSLEVLVCRFCIELIRYFSNLSDVYFVVFLKAKGRTRPKTLSKPRSLFHACWDQRGQTLGLRTKTLQFVFSSPRLVIAFFTMQVNSIKHIDKRNRSHEAAQSPTYARLF